MPTAIRRSVHVLVRLQPAEARELRACARDEDKSVSAVLQEFIVQGLRGKRRQTE